MTDTPDARQHPAIADVLLHIGYHKTGSTYLQNHFFVPANGFSRELAGDRSRIVRDIVYPDNFCFEPLACRAMYEPFIHAAENKGLRFVLSHERLSGYPPSGGYDRLVIADRLSRTFPQACVLIVIREQTSLIRSVYSQYVTDGGHLSLARFLEAPEPKLGRMPGFRLQIYEFDRLISHYQQLFGTERVLVIPFEMMLADLSAFLNCIAAFSGLGQVHTVENVMSNERRPVTMQIAQRWFNLLFSNNELSRGALVPVPRLPRKFARAERAFNRFTPRTLDKRMYNAMERDIKAFAGTHYHASNRRTAALTGLDLGKYGYTGF